MRASAGPSPPGFAAPRAARRPDRRRAARRGLRAPTAKVRSGRGSRRGSRRTRSAGEAARSPSMSIASFRQSPMVWRTSGWSGISRSPVRFSAHAIWSGKTAPIRSSAPMRASWGATLRPPRKRGSASDDAEHPAPARDEHRRVEHRLDQQGPHRGRVQIARDLGELEAVRGGERQHDVVLGRGRLELEVELAAEALAQRQPPGAIDAAAKGRMDHELHAARFIEEALEHDGVLAWARCRARAWPRRGSRRAAARRPRRCLRSSLSQAVRAARQRDRAAAARRSSARRRETAARARRCAPAPRPARTASSAAALRVLHAHDAALDPQDPIGLVAELEDVAGHALDREVLVHRADELVLGLEQTCNRRCREWRRRR